MVAVNEKKKRRKSIKEYSQREVGPDRGDDMARQGQADVTREKNRRVHSPPPERRIVQVSEREERIGGTGYH